MRLLLIVDGVSSSHSAGNYMFSPSASLFSRSDCKSVYACAFEVRVRPSTSVLLLWFIQSRRWTQRFKGICTHIRTNTPTYIYIRTLHYLEIFVYMCVRVFVVCEWDCELWVMFLFSFMIARGRASDTVTVTAAAPRGEQRTEEKNGGKRGRTSQPHGVFIPTALSLSVACWVKTKPWVYSQIE